MTRTVFLVVMGGAVIAMPPRPACGQRLDSFPAPPLAWTTYYPDTMWARFSRGLLTVGDTQTVIITTPRLRGRSVVLFGRMSGIIGQEAVGWVRQVGEHILIYVTRLNVGEFRAPALQVSVFQAEIGPLRRGSYIVHVIWEGEPRPAQFYEGSITVP